MTVCILRNIQHTGAHHSALGFRRARVHSALDEAAALKMGMGVLVANVEMEEAQPRETRVESEPGERRINGCTEASV